MKKYFIYFTGTNNGEVIIAKTMKNLKEIIENNPKDFKLSEKCNVVYNAVDIIPTGLNGNKEKVFKCIYSVYDYDLKNNIAYCESINAWGKYLYENHPLTNLAIYSNKPQHKQSYELNESGNF